MYRDVGICELLPQAVPHTSAKGTEAPRLLMQRQPKKFPSRLAGGGRPTNKSTPSQGDITQGHTHLTQ